MKSLGLINGVITELDQPAICIEDRAHQFGDGVYEVTRIYKGTLFAFDLHMQRLYRSLRSLQIPAAYTLDELERFHKTLIKESGIDEGIVYLQISRGTAARAHIFPEKTLPALTMTIRPYETPFQLQEKGGNLLTVPDIRWLRCDIKSLNLLGNILSKQKATQSGCFEALQIREEVVTEGSASNFIAIKDQVLWTHPANHLILNGITRQLIIEKLAPELGLHVLEKPFDLNFLATIEEGMITSSGQEIIPVNRIDKQQIGEGKPGPITKKLQGVYKELIKTVCG